MALQKGQRLREAGQFEVAAVGQIKSAGDNIAREWALMMAEERQRVWHARPADVIYLRDVLRRRREMRLSMMDGAGSADRARVVRQTRGPRSPRRG
ncbi:hypothetical protein [Xanthomonas phaseoli]|uniref:hypothetical protein n=1 Tax=Xanthomonas phaseoli TaxID=1985254 RepID=UPI00037A151E|nr:hypothetical protein [Xanthomonas phaseoli]